MPTLRKDEPVWVPNGGLGDLVHFARWLRKDDAVLLDVNEVQQARVEWLLRALKIEVPVVFKSQASGLWCEQWEYLSQRGGERGCDENFRDAYLKRPEVPKRKRKVVAVHGKGSRKNPSDVWRSCWRLPEFVQRNNESIVVRDLAAYSSATLEHLAEAIGTADYFIGVDSGPAHIAGAMGVPSVVILGASPDPRWGVGVPLYPSQKVERCNVWPNQWEFMADEALRELGL